MFDGIIDIKLDLETLKTNFGNMLKVGPVEQIDAEKGYRLKLGEEDGEPYLSPWHPHPESGKSSIPLKRGQIVGVLNPSGDPRMGLIMRGGYSDEHASPNDNMDANVFDDAGVKVVVVDGALVISAGGTTFNFSSGGFVQNGGKQEHDGKNTGATHDHGGIIRGSANTNPPN